MKPILYILCGPAGSGKSTWAKGFIASREIYNIDIHYVSRDEIRLSMLKDGEDYFAHENEVFNKFADTIYSILTNGLDVIADATHLNPKSRAKLIRAIDMRGNIDYDIIFVSFNVPYEVCKERNVQRTGRARVPEANLEQMYNWYREPRATEDVRCVGVWEVGDDR